jgi:hypothetical protein
MSDPYEELFSSADASFDGVWLGPFTFLDTAPLPLARQVNEYPGIDGIEVLRMGARGFESEGHGAFVGATGSAINQQFAVMYAYHQDGGAYTLIDQTGVPWDNVLVLDFRPDGGFYPARGGGYARRWKAQFLHVQPIPNQ